MKIFMYSDLHISRTSSILPQIEGKYSYRQQMIMQVGKWLAEIVKNEKPDVIINLGDTFDKHTVTSYDIDTASEFFSNFKEIKIPHIVIVGNHEMVNKDFNAIALLKNINNIWVIEEPSTITLNDTEQLAFLPYCNYKDIKELPNGKFLFSHIDIQGSSLRRGIDLKDGITQNELSKYQLIFNGHIHKPSIKGKVVNVGSITTHSFSDDEDTIPTAYIFDTNTMDLKQFKSSICPLFRKINISSTEELDKVLNNFNSEYKYCIQCTCPFEIKDAIKDKLQNNSLIISFRITTLINENTNTESSNNLNIQTSVDIIQTFKEFLQKDSVELKYPKSFYETVINNIN